jgi:beta-glucosidase
MGQIKKEDFGADFVWGVATASYQIEGAVKADGRSPSVWDTFSHTPGKVRGGANGDVACDFYHRYRDDLTYIQQMNMKVNRFSLAWSRIIPEGTGKVNPKGLDFYQRLIDRTLELGLEPWITLYHWDLPQVLEDQGGWTNRDIVGWFSEYAEVCTKAFGDRVKHWMVLNEPSVFTVLGYMQGLHAPGRKGFMSWLPAIHHAALAQAEGGRIVRSNVRGAVVGTTYSSSYIQPASNLPWHKGAAARFDAIANRLFLEPTLGLGYPIRSFPFLQPITRHFKANDEKKLTFDFDFIGLQTYFRMLVRFSLTDIGSFGREVPHKERTQEPLTEMGWEVYPPNIYHLLKQFGAYKGVKRIIVTENGAAFPDEVKNGQVHDLLRQSYIQNHLEQVLRAKREGVKVGGYLCWSLLDNFEWAEGYRPRFGLVYVDYTSQRRILKDSGRWFAQFLA